MIRRYSIIMFLVLAVLILAQPGCKKWEGKYALYLVEGSTLYYPNTDESSFGGVVQVVPDESDPISAEFFGWQFEFLMDDQSLVKVNSANYEYLDYTVTIHENLPVADREIGSLNVVSGKVGTKFRVPGDLFNGLQPNKMKYETILYDENGHEHRFSGEIPINHTIIEENLQ